MSASGTRRQTRSQTAGSVAPSVVGSHSGSDTTSRHAGSQAGSRAGTHDGSRKIRGPRSLDTYGSKDSDRAAAQQRRQELSQNVGSAFGRSFAQDARRANPSRVLDPNDQFQQAEPSGIFNTSRTNDTTGNDFVHHDLDGATARHTPANNFARAPRQTSRYIAANTAPAKFDFDKFAWRWLSYLVLVMLTAACLAAFTYYSTVLIKYEYTTRTGGKIHALDGKIHSLDGNVQALDGNFQAFVQGHESLVQQVARYDEILNHRMDSMEERLLNLKDHEDLSIFGGKQSVDWFHPSNMAVTISKYTSPEKLRKVGGWLGLFKKQAAFNHVPKIVGPFDGVEKMWCAPSDHGKAQITVLLSKKIIPRVLIVEQVDTKDTTPYWQSFPDQIEFWASFDENAREPIITHWPSWVPGEKSQGRKLANAQALPSSFKMLGRWNYELANRRRKQAFHIAVDQYTNLVSFRVNTNHGDADQMCLHRLRLYGMAEPEMDPGRKIYDEDREYVLK